MWGSSSPWIEKRGTARCAPSIQLSIPPASYPRTWSGSDARFPSTMPVRSGRPSRPSRRKRYADNADLGRSAMLGLAGRSKRFAPAQLASGPSNRPCSMPWFARQGRSPLIGCSNRPRHRRRPYAGWSAKDGWKSPSSKNPVKGHSSTFRSLNRRSS